MKVKAGQRIGIVCEYYGDKWLYCVVLERTEHPLLLRCHVINGNWDFWLDVESCVATLMNPMKHQPVHHAGWKVAFDDYIPVDVRFDYNAAIEYMEAETKRFWISRKISRLKRCLLLRLRNLRAATFAFKEVYSGRGYLSKDRDIPF